MAFPGLRIKTIALAWAFAQATMPATLVLTDALTAEHTGRAQVTHVEEGPGSGCRSAHSAECAVCRFLSTNHSAPAASEPAPWTDARAVRAPVIRRLPPV